MAKAKSDRENGASEHELVTMARGLAEIAAAHNLSELIVDTKETTLTIRRGGGGAMTMAMPQMMSPMAMPQMQMQMPQTSGTAHAPAGASPAAAASDDKSHIVTSPFVGTFYRKPNPDSANYVSLGDKVDKGQALCIVEAMKLMNEIDSEYDGEVVNVYVENGQPVQYGERLFAIRTR